MRLGDTPVPIPNTMVKTQAADGTALETVWESRWLPEYITIYKINTIITQWGCSSVGRAPALQAGGQEFESLHLHLIMKRTAEPAEEGRRCMLACISLDSQDGKDIRRISVSERNKVS